MGPQSQSLLAGRWLTRRKLQMVERPVPGSELDRVQRGERQDGRAEVAPVHERKVTKDLRSALVLALAEFLRRRLQMR
jgi:hypothetical protein